jgi:hypothetical protein
MNTLREIGNFVGIPQGSLEVARWGGPRIVTLRKVSLLVTKRERPASMRAIIQALQNLTPITLETQIVGSRSGEEPFEPVIRLNASGGIPWDTFIHYFQDGRAMGGSEDLGSSGGDFSPTQLGPGKWQFVVKRSGISNTGFVSLSKTLDTITVSARPTPPQPDHVLPPVVKPVISVRSNGDGSFKVSGLGFVPKNATVNILVGDGTLNQNPLNFVVSATDGAFEDFPTGKICQRPGQIFFQASDGRIDHGSQVFSNTVTISCPF